MVRLSPLVAVSALLAVLSGFVWWRANNVRRAELELWQVANESSER